jgi:hypothetical protein
MNASEASVVTNTKNVEDAELALELAKVTEKTKSDELKEDKEDLDLKTGSLQAAIDDLRYA